MKIRFWGVRGSIATPGEETAGVGGTTSCVEVVCGRTRIVLDAGTGLRGLGNDLITKQEDPSLTLLLSHYHWDHIQGLPFYVPIYMRGTALTIMGGANGISSVRDALERQMSAPVFPVRLDEVGAKITTREVKPSDAFDVGEARVRVARGNHPGGVVAYRIEHEGKSIVYATDTEHYACVDPGLRALCDGCDVLVYDSQYTPDEYRAKVGWGHSTYVAGVELARASGARSYVLYHHDPTRTDADVADLEQRAQALFPSSVAAREGLTLDLTASSPIRARSAAAGAPAVP